MKRILLFLKTPPPVHGASLMNLYVKDSIFLRKNFRIRDISISYAKSKSDIGKITLSRFIIVISVIIKLLFELLFHRPDLVYFQISPINIAFLRDSFYVFILKIFRANILFHIHGKGISQSKSFLLKKLYKFVFKNSSVICLSEKLTYDVKDVYPGVPYILNNGIPPIKMNKSTSNDKKIKIIYLSNLVKTKGIFEYLEASVLLAKSNLNFSALIIGKEGDVSESELMSYIDDKKLNNYVDYLGPIYNKEKYDILRKCDIFVFPTFYKNEAFPLVILEAMQNGIPVVTTKEGAIPEIIDDGITGFLVDKNRPEQIAQKIEILLKNKSLRKKMGEAGRKKFIEKYTLDKFEENLVNILDHVLGN